jgi:hypothetical protein
VLGVAVVFAGAAYPVTAAALRYTSASVITTTRALGGGLLMLPVLALIGARLPQGRRAWGLAALISVGNVVLTLAGIAEGTRLAGAGNRLRAAKQRALLRSAVRTAVAG